MRLPAVRDDLADQAALDVGDVEVAGSIERHIGGAVELGRRTGAVGLAERPLAGHRPDLAGAVHGQRLGLVEAGPRAGAVGEARLPRARKRADDAVRGNLADAVVAGVGDVEVAGAVQGDAGRTGELRLCARSVDESRRAV